MGGGVSEETVEACHGFGGGVRLLGRKGASGGQETGIDSTTVVKQVANGYLQFFGLGWGGWGGSVGGGRRLRCGGAVRRRGVEKGRSSVSYPIGTEAGK